MNDVKELPRRFKIRDAAIRHGLSVWILRQAAREKRIEFFQIGNRYEFTDDAICEFLNSNRQSVAA